MASNIPVLMVSPCNKGGIETAAVDIAAHVDKMNKLNPYFLNVKLKQDAVKNLQSEFRLHDAVMLKCSYKGMLIYYSTTVSSICNNAGFSIFIPNDVQAKL